MSEILAGAGAMVFVGDKLVSVDHSTDLAALPEAVKKELRKIGSLVKADGSDASDPEGGSVPDPDAAIDVESASVQALAEYIQDQKLTGPQTVALAGNDPKLAEKVIEAEELSTGGDARSTVVQALTKVADQS